MRNQKKKKKHNSYFLPIPFPFYVFVCVCFFFFNNIFPKFNLCMNEKKKVDSTGIFLFNSLRMCCVRKYAYFKEYGCLWPYTICTYVLEPLFVLSLLKLQFTFIYLFTFFCRMDKMKSDMWTSLMTYSSFVVIVVDKKKKHTTK